MDKGSKQTLIWRRHMHGQWTHEEMLNIISHQGNTKQSHNEIPFTSTRTARNDKYWWGCGEIRTVIHHWWEFKMMQQPWKAVCVPQKVKHSITIWSSNSTLRYVAKRTESRDWHRYSHTSVHGGIIHESRKVEAIQWPNNSNSWIHQTQYIHTVKYYSAITWNEALIHASIRMNPENLIPSKRSQSQRTMLYNSIYMKYPE